MPLGISAYIGFYIKAPCPDNSGTVLVNACPTHGEMNCAFCPSCGERVVKQSKFVESKNSISEVLYDPEGEFASTMSPEDVEFILENVTHIEASEIGDDDNCVDYFFLDGDYVFADALDGAQISIDLDEFASRPANMRQEAITRIVKAVGYKSYQICFGTLISVSY